jgi:glyoxylate/hydroxypyruvate reductase A
MSLLLCAQIDNTDTWMRELRAAMPDEELWIWPDVPDIASVDIALVAKPPPGIVAQFPGLRLIASLWAGVDGLLADLTWPRHIPLTRLIDPQLTAAMVESVVLHVLSAHRLAPRYRAQQAQAEWIQHEQPSAAERTIVILGLGELGRACADALAPFGFTLVGWSRSPRSHARVETLSGADGLQRALSRADILVCLLPNTADTQRLLNVKTLALLPRGSSVINVGRGTALDDDALLSALDSGHVEAAILDVFNAEPLPATHRYWRHERVWVYPHVAAETDPRSAARVVADTIRRFRAGEALPERVDPDRGY